jgi:hypothetical protein
MCSVLTGVCLSEELEAAEERNIALSTTGGGVITSSNRFHISLVYVHTLPLHIDTFVMHNIW